MGVFFWLVAWSVIFVAPVYAQEPAKIRDIVTVLEKIIGLLAPAAGLAFFVVVLLAGFKFIRSGGDPKSAGEARSYLQYAVIGIILVAASWLILQLIANLTGANVTSVEIP